MNEGGGTTSRPLLNLARRLQLGVSASTVHICHHRVALFHRGCQIDHPLVIHTLHAGGLAVCDGIRPVA